MTSIIGKTFRINSHTSNSDARELSDQEIIRKLNYEELEKRFQIYKYYPSFFHNNDCSTPRLKALICDKPIYAKASGTVPAVEQKSRKAKRIEARKADMQERQNLKPDQKKEKHAPKEQKRHDRKESSNTVKNIDKLSVEHIEDVSDKETEKGLDEKHNNVSVFNNPFGSGQVTLQTKTSRTVGSDQRGQTDRSNLDRRVSISERLRGLFIKKSSHENPAKRSMSFDQTKTNMTTSRAAEHILMKLTENRRPSDEIRTYIFYSFEQLHKRWKIVGIFDAQADTPKL